MADIRVALRDFVRLYLGRVPPTYTTRTAAEGLNIQVDDRGTVSLEDAMQVINRSHTTADPNHDRLMTGLMKLAGVGQPARKQAHTYSYASDPREVWNALRRGDTERIEMSTLPAALLNHVRSASAVLGLPEQTKSAVKDEWDKRRTAGDEEVVTRQPQQLMIVINDSDFDLPARTAEKRLSVVVGYLAGRIDKRVAENALRELGVQHHNIAQLVSPAARQQTMQRMKVSREQSERGDDAYLTYASTGQTGMDVRGDEGSVQPLASQPTSEPAEQASLLDQPTSEPPADTPADEQTGEPPEMQIRSKEDIDAIIDNFTYDTSEPPAEKPVAADPPPVKVQVLGGEVAQKEYEGWLALAADDAPAEPEAGPQPSQADVYDVLDDYTAGNLSDGETARRLLAAGVPQAQVRTHIESVKSLGDANKLKLIQQAHAAQYERMAEQERNRSGRKDEPSPIQGEEQPALGEETPEASPVVVQEQTTLGADFATNEQLGMIVETTDGGARQLLTEAPAPLDPGQSHFLSDRPQADTLTEAQEIERNTGQSPRTEADSVAQSMMTEPASAEDLGALWERYSAQIMRRRTGKLLTSSELAKPPEERDYPQDFYDWMREQGLEPPSRVAAETPSSTTTSRDIDPRDRSGAMQFATTAEFWQHYESMSDEHQEGFDDYMRENGLDNTSELSDLNAAMELYHEESQDYLWEEDSPPRVRQTNRRRTPHVQPPDELSGSDDVQPSPLEESMRTELTTLDDFDLMDLEKEADGQNDNLQLQQDIKREWFRRASERRLVEGTPPEEEERARELHEFQLKVGALPGEQHRGFEQYLNEVRADRRSSPELEAALVAYQQAVESGERPEYKKRPSTPQVGAIRGMTPLGIQQSEPEPSAVEPPPVRIRMSPEVRAEVEAEQAAQQSEPDPLARDAHGYFVDSDAASVVLEDMSLDQLRQIEPDMDGTVVYLIGKYEDAEREASIYSDITTLKSKSMAEIEDILFTGPDHDRLRMAASDELRRRQEEAMQSGADLTEFTEHGLRDLEADVRGREEYADLQGQVEQEWLRRQDGVEQPHEQTPERAESGPLARKEDGYFADSEAAQEQTDTVDETMTAPEASLDPLGDADADGVQNFEDPDDDNDGIPDTQDATPQGVPLPGERLEQFRRIPLEDIKIRPDLFQFRKTGQEGVNDADVQQLYDRWDDAKAKAIQVVWVDGEWVVVEGHHRFMAKQRVEADPEKNALHETGLKTEILSGDTTTPEGRAAIRTQALAGNYEHRDIGLATQLENFRELIQMEHNGIDTPGQAGARLNWPSKRTEQMTTLMHLPSNIWWQLEQDEDLIRYAVALGERVQSGMFTPDEAWAYWKGEVDVEARPGIGRFRDDLRSVATMIANKSIIASDMFAHMEEGQFAGELSYSPAAKVMIMRRARLADIKQERSAFRGYLRDAKKLSDALSAVGIDVPVEAVRSVVEDRLKVLDEYEQRAKEGDLSPLPPLEGLAKAVQENGEAVRDPDGDNIPNAVDIDDDGDGTPDAHDDSPRGEGSMPEDTQEDEQPKPGFGTTGITSGPSIMDDPEEEEEPSGPLPGQTGMFGGVVNEEGDLQGDDPEKQPDDTISEPPVFEQPPESEPIGPEQPVSTGPEEQPEGDPPRVPTDDPVRETEGPEPPDIIRERTPRPHNPEEIRKGISDLGGAIAENARLADRETRMRKFINEGVPIDPISIVRQYGNDEEAMQILQSPDDAFKMTEAEARAVVEAAKGSTPSNYQHMIGGWRQRILNARQAYIEKQKEKQSGGQSPSPTGGSPETPSPTAQDGKPIGDTPKREGEITLAPPRFGNSEKMPIEELDKTQAELISQIKSGKGMSSQHLQTFRKIQAEIDKRVKADPSLTAKLSGGSAAPELPAQGTTTQPKAGESAPKQPNAEVVALIAEKQKEVQKLDQELGTAQSVVAQLKQQEESIQARWEGSEPGSEHKKRLEEAREVNSCELSDAESAVNRLESSRNSAQAALHRMQGTTAPGTTAQATTTASTNGTGPTAPPPPDDPTASTNGTGPDPSRSRPRNDPAASFINRFRQDKAKKDAEDAAKDAAGEGEDESKGGFFGRFRKDPNMKAAEDWYKKERRRLLGMRKDQGYDDLLPDDIYYLHMGRNDFENTGEEPAQQTPNAAYPPPENENDALAAQRLREKARDEMMEMRGEREDELERMRLKREGKYEDGLAAREFKRIDRLRRDRLSKAESEEQRSESRQERRFERSQRRLSEEEVRREARAEARAYRQAARAWGGAPPAPVYGASSTPFGSAYPSDPNSQVFSDVLDETVGIGPGPVPQGGLGGASQVGDWHRRRDRFGRFAPGGTTPPPRTPRARRLNAPLSPDSVATPYGEDYDTMGAPAASTEPVSAGQPKPAHGFGCACPECYGKTHAAGCLCAECGMKGHAAGCSCPGCDEGTDDRDVSITLNFDSQNISDSQNADNASEVVIKTKPEPQVAAAAGVSGRGDAAVQLKTALFPFKEGEISREEAADRLRDLGVSARDINPTLNRFDDYAYGKPLVVPNRVLDSIVRHSKDDESEGGYSVKQLGESEGGGHNKTLVMNTGVEDDAERPQKTLSAAMRARGAGAKESGGRKRSSGTAGTKRSPSSSSNQSRSRSSTAKKGRRKGGRKAKGGMAKSMLGG